MPSMRNSHGATPTMRGITTMAPRAVADQPDQDLIDQAVAGGKSLVALRLAQSTQTTVTRTKKEAPPKIPLMRSLRNILGDGVLEIFPLAMRESVDAVYKFWVDHPDSYQVTPFESEEEKEEALIVMRAYAECAWDTGYTIRVVSDDDPSRLVWRAQNRRGVKGSE
jgi:hypothetical protein